MGLGDYEVLEELLCLSVLSTGDSESLWVMICLELRGGVYWGVSGVSQ